MAPAAAVDLPHDPVAVQHRSGLRQRRAWQLRRLPDDLAALGIRQRIDSHDLDRQIVGAALALGFCDDRSCRAIQVARIFLDCLGDKSTADMLVNAVGRKQEKVTLFDRDGTIVDLDLGIDA